MKRMIITGTTRGIGQHLANRYKGFYEIYSINRRDCSGNNIICDLSNVEDVERLCERLKHFEFDVLINNAGGASPRPLDELSATDLEYCTHLNFTAPALLMNIIGAGMINRGYGRIINISSIASKSPRNLLSHYGAAKAALERFSTSFALHCAHSGVTVNCVRPGGVATEVSIENRRMIARLSGQDVEAVNRSIAMNNGLGRLISVEEVGDIIDYLLSDDATAITGQCFNICGLSEVN